jgi:peptidoglycan hydrolase-like protein with peptidoglycan-binding domain
MRNVGTRVSLLVLGVVVASLLGTATAAAASPRYPHQSLGNRGADVRAVQGFLRHHGATELAVDGIFGSTTEVAVKAFQTARGLPASGQVDGATWSWLLVKLATGSTGEAVMVLQRQLTEKRNLPLVVTGVFDEPTAGAVRAFQRHAGLPVTGVVYGTTWRALIGHFERPIFGPGRVCDYSVGNGPANWGTAAAIGQVEAAGIRVFELGHGRVAIGDIGLEHGGDIAGHVSHEHGLDVDVRPMRRLEDQCRVGVSWRSSSYDRAATRDLVRAVRATARGHIKLIWFNDPVLIREGLVRWHSGHDDHLHIRYCEKIHPIAAYDC